MVSVAELIQVEDLSGADCCVADTLDRFEVPVFGRLASGFVDAE